MNCSELVRVSVFDCTQCAAGLVLFFLLEEKASNDCRIDAIWPIGRTLQVKSKSFHAGLNKEFDSYIVNDDAEDKVNRTVSRSCIRCKGQLVVRSL